MKRPVLPAPRPKVASAPTRRRFVYDRRKADISPEPDCACHGGLRSICLARQSNRTYLGGVSGGRACRSPVGIALLSCPITPSIVWNADDPSDKSDARTYLR